MPGMLVPSRYPAIVTPSVQASPPVTCQKVNVAAGTSRIPAIGLATVRTTGMNRASTIALPGPRPCSLVGLRAAGLVLFLFGPEHGCGLCACCCLGGGCCDEV